MQPAVSGRGQPSAPSSDTLRRTRDTAMILLLTFNGVDIGLTQYLLGNGATEANPLMRPIAATPVAWLVKIGIPVAVVAMQRTRPIGQKRLVALCAVCAVYAGVVAWNAHLATSL